MTIVVHCRCSWICIRCFGVIGHCRFQTQEVLRCCREPSTNQLQALDKLSATPLLRLLDTWSLKLQLLLLNIGTVPTSHTRNLRAG